ncbi:MAG: hypothetical protein CME61_04230 [Halobacteriovoraceae bacterium]|nr:hypothetical protein [Halobacteriovoraceae bacterium]|tara:strand:+ start:458 stop:1132 length:675 start_codon:yes stop_codon:yes gene_type:complete
MTKNKNIFHHIFFYTGFVTLLSLTIFFKSDLKLKKFYIDPDLDEINFHEDFYKVVNLGQKRMISSLIWSHTLLFGDTEHIKEKNRFSWMFHRFNSISLIDPLFYENYFLGGQYLGVVKDDVLGSNRIFTKGLKNFPLDVELNFNLGFNHLFYNKDVNTGIKYWKRILAVKDIEKLKPLLPIRIMSFLKNREDRDWSLNILKDLAQKNKGTPIGDAYEKKLKNFK